MMLQSKPNTSNGNHGKYKCLSDVKLGLSYEELTAQINEKRNKERHDKERYCSLFDESERQSKHSDEDSLFDRQRNHSDESSSASEDVGMDESKHD